MADYNVKAEVRPLSGKHYGTTVKLIIATRAYDINVWIPLGPPSEADLESWGVTQQQWMENVEVDDGWGGAEPIQRMYPCDNHYQSEVEKVVAEHIAYALNVLSITIPEETSRG